jgi:GTPase SAR1 family protein
MYNTQTDRRRVVILGIQGAGKTSALERVKDAFSADVKGLLPEQIIPTVGMNIANLSAGNAKLPVDMTFWDLGGAFGLRGIWESYFADADACVYVVDGADEDALEEAMVELERVLRNKKFSTNIPTLIISSKSDLAGPEGLEMVRALCEDVFARVASSAARRGSRREWKIFPVDGLSGAGIRPAIEWLANTLAPKTFWSSFFWE